MYLKPLHSLKSFSACLRTQLLPLSLSIGLAACSHTPSHEASSDSTQTPALDNWELTAKMGIRQGEQRTGAKILWRQCGDSYRIRLSGAFGVTGADIKGQPGHVVLRRPGEEAVVAESPEALLADYGWPAPVSALRYWLRGEAEPNQPYTKQMSESKQLSGIDQGGWEIRFSPSLAENSLPERSNISRNDLELLLVGQRWQRNSSCQLDSDTPDSGQ